MRSQLHVLIALSAVLHGANFYQVRITPYQGNLLSAQNKCIGWKCSIYYVLFSHFHGIYATPCILISLFVIIYIMLLILIADMTNLLYTESESHSSFRASLRLILCSASWVSLVANSVLNEMVWCLICPADVM